MTSYSIAAIRFPVSGLFGHLSQSKPSLSEPFSLAEREEFSNQRQICLVVTPCVGKIKSKRIFEQIPPQFAGPLRSRKLLRSSCSCSLSIPTNPMTKPVDAVAAGPPPIQT